MSSDAVWIGVGEDLSTRGPWMVSVPGAGREACAQPAGAARPSSAHRCPRRAAQVSHRPCSKLSLADAALCLDQFGLDGPAPLHEARGGQALVSQDRAPLPRSAASYSAMMFALCAELLAPCTATHQVARPAATHRHLADRWTGRPASCDRPASLEQRRLAPWPGVRVPRPGAAAGHAHMPADPPHRGARRSCCATILRWTWVVPPPIMNRRASR